jgi:hypothetical protein
MFDAKKMSIAELESARDQTQIDLMNIKEQLEEYNVLKDYDEQSVDKEDHLWSVSAKKAQRVKGFQHQLICRELADRKRLLSAIKTKSLANYFMDVTRQELSKELFDSIYQKSLLLKSIGE